MKPYTENPILLTTKIVTLNSSLQGVSPDTNLTFRYTDIGDEVTYEQRGRGKNKFAKVESILRANEYNPRCRHFADCGGCSGQHIAYERQFQVKTKEILEKFKANHNFQPDLAPATKLYNYRNRMDFAVFPGFIGLRQAENFRRIINVSKCELQSDWANQELTQLRNLIQKEFSNLPLDRRTGEGYLKYITLRTNQTSSDTITIFTFIEEFQDTELEEKFISEVLKFSRSNNIVFCYNRKQSEVSADGKLKIVRGKSYFTEEIHGKQIQVPFNSFFQPNPDGFIPIIRFIEEILQNTESSTLIDLFCGNGFFSILFGDRFQHLIGYDWVESSIQTATENLTRIYPDKKIKFEKKDLLQFKDVFTSSNSIPKDSILILDPPRNGIGTKLTEYILESEIENILYVSCNPNSQLEDLKILSQKYQILSGLITDPYPHTPHLESVLFLKREPAWV
ncbi:MAG: class I SAM-dependent RNA methyltransferase [Leptospiraceae bacterium]|nr:class I SAM-dependent RNA methyltransferase [Leptospiraceae bacterium]